MNNTSLYEYTAEAMRETLKKNVDNFSKAMEYRPNKSLFRIGNDSYELLRIVDEFTQSSILSCSRELIIKMMDNNRIRYETNEIVDFCISESGRTIGYEIVLSQKFDIDVEKAKKKGIDEVRFIVLEEATGDEYTIWEPNSEKYKNTCKGYVKNISVKDYFFRMFSLEEYEIFKKYAEQYNSEAEALIGINVTVSPSEKAMDKYREKVLGELEVYPYLEKFKDVYDEDELKTINERFSKRYKVLVENTDFAKSFVSSEWYYDMQVKTDGCLEHTAIVAGYFKSVEQLLFAIIKLSIDRDISIEVMKREKKEGEGNYIRLTQSNIARVNAMLGSLRKCIAHPPNELFSVNNYIKKKTNNVLKEYCDKSRNGYFHKDNLYKWEDIKAIRENTFQIMFLILGCLCIDEDKIEKLGNGAIVVEEPIINDITYNSFTEWIDKLLAFDNLEDNKVIIFNLHPGWRDGNHLMELFVSDTYIDNGFGTTKEEGNYPHLVKTLFRTQYKWHSEEKIEAVQNKLKDIVMDYLEKGANADVLKKFNVIAVGRLGHYEVIHNR